MAQGAGIEPTLTASKAVVLPIYKPCMLLVIVQLRGVPRRPAFTVGSCPALAICGSRTRAHHWNGLYVIAFRRYHLVFLFGAIETPSRRP